MIRPKEMAISVEVVESVVVGGGKNGIRKAGAEVLQRKRRK